MYRDLPIEQLVRRADTRFQLGFANEARDLVPAREEFMLSPTRHGLRVLGRNEESLEQPVAVLRDVYGRARGARVEVGASRLRILDTLQRNRATLSGAASGVLPAFRGVSARPHSTPGTLVFLAPAR